MKRNIRVILLLALVVLMLGVTALVAAATEPEETDFFEVLDASGAHVSYVATPANAISAAADNYTLKLLKDIDLSAAVAFSADKTYTLDGNGHTVNFTGIAQPTRCNSLNVTKGKITLKNLTVKTTHDNLKVLILFNAPAPATLTLDGVTLEGGGIQIIDQNSGTLTFKGNDNVIGKNNKATAQTAIDVKAASSAGRIVVEGGQFIARSNLFKANGAFIEIQNGTFTNSDGSTTFVMDDANFVSAVKITNGTFTLSTGGLFFDYSGTGDCVGFAENGNATVNISGGVFTHLGTGNLFRIAAQSVADKSSSGGTMFTFGYPVVKISDGGTSNDTRLGVEATVKLPLFDGWPDEEDWVQGRRMTGDPGLGTIGAYVIELQNTVARLDISGGTYIGSPYTEGLIYTNGAAENGCEAVNITGGTFMGARAWLKINNSITVNIGGTSEFLKPSPSTYELNQAVFTTTQTVISPISLPNGGGRQFTTNEDGVVTGYSRQLAAVLNITGGTFTIRPGESTFWINAAGGDVNISGGTFNIGGRGIQMNDSTMISYVRVSGGTFNGSGTGELFYYDGKPSSSNVGNQHGLLEITGGTFTTRDKSTLLQYECAHEKRATVGDGADGYVHISGGTFRSDGIYLFYIRNSMAGELVISDGTFEGTAPRLVSLASFKGQITFSGGTWRLSALNEGQTVSSTDAIIYIRTTSSVPVLNITGGTYINDRAGAGRLILFDSQTATLNLLGGRFMTSQPDMTNYVERYMNHGNMPFHSALSDKETIDGVEYYIDTVHAPSNVNAPVLNADVTIRLNQDTPGIRFTSYMSKAKIDALTEAGATNISYGTIIAPYEYLRQITNYGDVIGQLKGIAAAAGLAESKVFADVAATEAGMTTDEEGNVTFRAALVGITDVNKGFGAISYVKVTIGGNEVYYYAGFNTGSGISSLKAVVLRELGDISDRAVVVGRGQYVYKYGSINDDGFSRFTQPEQNFMRRLVAGK